MGLPPALAMSRPATGNWTITFKAERFVEKQLRDSQLMSLVRTEFVCLDWTYGGWAVGPDHRRLPLRPEYGISLFKKNEVPPTAFILPSRLFGHICFTPKPADARSVHRLIDFDGKDIVVR
jgi:hypothetical protein